jgi:hypothetical protein
MTASGGGKPSMPADMDPDVSCSCHVGAHDRRRHDRLAVADPHHPLLLTVVKDLKVRTRRG